MKISNIILNGCSFVEGFDLCYDEFGNNLSESYYDAKAKWTQEQFNIFNDKKLSGRLRKYYNCNVVDLSSSGENNYWIAETTINYVNDNKNNLNLNETIVLIGWTDITRFCLNLTNHRDNLSLMHLENYIKYTSMLKRDKHTIDSLNLYNKLSPLKEMYDQYPQIINQYHHNHFCLILMVQQFMKSLGIKCVMWQSLPVWPFNENYRHDYKNLSDIIDWRFFWPHGEKDSYLISWGENLIKKSGPYHTASGHPSVLAVEEFSRELTNFIDFKIK